MSTILKRTDDLLKVESNGLYKWQNDALSVIKDKDAVVVAPPGAGKSLVAYNWADIVDDSSRTIITCPTKAKVNDYVLELQNQGFDVGINTGDAKFNTDANIIVCTQELYNLQYAELPNQKVIVDEFHYALDDDVRRNAYMYGIQTTNPNSNLLIMSATLSDSEYVANEISKITNRDFINYTSNVRATDLEIHDTPLDFENELCDIKNALVFTYSVNSVTDIAYDIAHSDNRSENEERKNIIDNLSSELDIELNSYEKDILYRGVGTYYGKMMPIKKMFVTELYKQGVIDSIVGTDALSVGINLPAENVVFASDKFSGLTDGDLVQQASRAGRKGFYETGHVYVTDRFMQTGNMVSYDIGNGIRGKFEEIDKEFENLNSMRNEKFLGIRDEILSKYSENERKEAISEYSIYYISDSPYTYLTDQSEYRRLYALVRDSEILTPEDKELYLHKLAMYGGESDKSDIIKEDQKLIDKIQELKRERENLSAQNQHDLNEHYKDVATRLSNPVIEKENLVPVDINAIDFDGQKKDPDNIITSLEQLCDKIPSSYIFMNSLTEQMVADNLYSKENCQNIPIEQYLQYIKDGKFDTADYFEAITEGTADYWDNHYDYLEDISEDHEEEHEESEEYDEYEEYDDYYDYEEEYDHWVDDFNLDEPADRINYLLEIKRVFAEYNRNNLDAQIDLKELNNLIDGQDNSIMHFNEVVNTIDAYFKNDLEQRKKNIMELENKTLEKTALNQSASDYVRDCIANAATIDDGPGTPTLLDYVINQRLEGPTNAGSDFGETDPKVVHDMLVHASWTEVEGDLNVASPNRLFRTEDIAGNMGICDLKDVPEGTVFWAIDPKNTGNIMVGATNIPKTEVSYTHLIVSPAREEGGKDVVVTTFPGDTAPDKSIPAKVISHGTPLTRKQVERLGFDKIKYISNDMEKEFYKNFEFENEIEDTLENDFDEDIDNSNEDQDWDPLGDE